VHLVRPLILGQWPATPLSDLAILIMYCSAGFYVATILTRRRLLK
jgi:lipooligosaccharide transport system permease protein